MQAWLILRENGFAAAEEQQSSLAYPRCKCSSSFSWMHYSTPVDSGVIKRRTMDVKIM
jgi:hypothetical protein